MKKNGPARNRGAARGQRRAKLYKKYSSTSLATEQAPAGSKALPRRHSQILALLRDRGRDGVSKLDCSRAMSLGMSVRICELRQLGYGTCASPATRDVGITSGGTPNPLRRDFSFRLSVSPRRL